MKKVFIIGIVVIVGFLAFAFISSLKHDKKEIYKVNHLELNNIVDLKKDVILLISGKGCPYCRYAEKAIKKSFYGNKFNLFQEIGYEDLENNKLINKKDLKDGIPVTLVIKKGLVVEKIQGYFEDIYIPKLDSLITANYK